MSHHYSCFRAPCFSTQVLLVQCPNSDITDDNFRQEFVISASDPADAMGIAKLISLGKSKQEKLLAREYSFYLARCFCSAKCTDFLLWILWGWTNWSSATSGSAITGQQAAYSLPSPLVSLPAQLLIFKASTCLWRSKMGEADWAEQFSSNSAAVAEV